MKHLLLIACAALLFTTACKSRKVLTTRIDSAVVRSIDKNVTSVQTSIDTGKVITKQVVINKDSSTTVIEATPIPGTIATINKDGSITGTFKGIKSTNTKKNDTRYETNTNEQKGLTNTTKVDSAVKVREEIKVSKKTKSTDAVVKGLQWWLWALIAASVLLALYSFLRSKIKLF
jgi:hypothetical protein